MIAMVGSASSSLVQSAAGAAGYGTDDIRP
jgi:hypothetical protein